jgi:hypothetical protein
MQPRTSFRNLKDETFKVCGEGVQPPDKAAEFVFDRGYDARFGRASTLDELRPDYAAAVEHRQDGGICVPLGS